MPNHVYYECTVEGPQAEIDVFFFKHCPETEKRGQHLDFGTFIPFPEELEGTKAPVDNPNDPENYRLRQLYGYDNWYDWKNAKWGTKWGAYEFEMYDTNSFRFQTAWSTPDPVFEKWAEMYPNLTFIFKVCEEGGFFAGEIVFRNGEVKENLFSSSEDEERWWQFAGEMMGWYRDEDEDDED